MIKKKPQVIHLPPEDHARLKAMCQERGIEMSALVMRLLTIEWRRWKRDTQAMQEMKVG
jgi:hypothetical protein